MKTIDLSSMYNKILAVSVNQQTIEMLKETNSKYLKAIVTDNLKTGKNITENLNDNQLANLNNLLFTPWRESEFKKSYNNVNHIKSYPERLYFISDKSITEVYFADTLKVSEFYELIANTDNEFTIELTFRSERVRNREQIIYGNKYRFNWSKLTNKMTVRKLTE